MIQTRKEKLGHYLNNVTETHGHFGLSKKKESASRQRFNGSGTHAFNPDKERFHQQMCDDNLVIPLNL